jgi:RND family efflux transporter MFP subunit
MNRALIQRFLQPSVIITLTAIIAVCVIAVAYIVSGSKPAEAYIAPTSGLIIQTVNTTGTVVAANSVDLSFQSGGAITYAGPKVGTHVSAGTVLGTVSGADLQAQLEQAKAGLAAQEAQLAVLNAGATPQSVAVYQTAVTNAQNVLTQAMQSIIQASQDGYVKSDDAIHNKADQFFNNPRSTSLSLSVMSSNSQLNVSLISDRISIETVIYTWQSYLASLSNDPSSVDILSLESKTSAYLAQVSSFLNESAQLLSSATPSTGFSVTTLQGYQNNIATARANISVAVTELNSSEIALQNANSGLATAKSQLTLTQAPPTSNVIAAQEATVASAQANVDLVRAQINKTVISAPITGTITVNNIKIGETASVGTAVISMISNAKFQMDVFISNADVAKIKLGDVASVTLDAYQNSAPFASRVTAIDPAATITNGVSSYKITLQFDDNDPRVQSGMTGSASITTESHEQALSVPTSAIITQGTSTFVFVKSSNGTSKANQDREVLVTIGLNSASGMSEVLSGISISDQIRTFGNQ